MEVIYTKAKTIFTIELHTPDAKRSFVNIEKKLLVFALILFATIQMKLANTFSFVKHLVEITSTIKKTVGQNIPIA